MKKIEILKAIYSKYGFKILMAFSMLLFIIATEILSPILLKYLIDVGIASKNVTLVLQFTVAYFIIFILTSLFDYLYNLYFAKINSEVINYLKLNLFSRILNLEKKEYDRYNNGYLLSRLNEDSENISTLFADTFFDIIKNILYLFGSFSIMLYFNWKLALIILLFIPIYFCIAILFSSKIQSSAQEAEESKAVLFSKLKEFIDKFKLIKLTSTSRLFAKRIETYQDRYYQKDIANSKIIYLNQFITSLISSMIPLIIVGYGSYETINGNLTIGAIFAFLNYANYTISPAGGLMSANAQIQQGITSLNRYLEILNLCEEKTGNKEINKLERIELKNLNFTYDNKPFLSEVDFEISRGDKVVIIGDSGSGKTTISNLINGLYKPDKGEVLINGNNLSEYKLCDVRAKIAFIDQEPVLIDDSLLYNIVLKEHDGTTVKDEESVKKVIDIVHGNFIYDFSEGLNHQINNNGENLSTGQKQRIALARALINEPDVLILDEPLTGLDSVSKTHIINFIKNFPSEKILIIITHSQDLLKYGTKTLVIDNGLVKTK